ncbi:MAG: multidrug efflux RND transporter permease subunit [Paludibacterium sp.]|uniref:multidrug efflux RND transporter permease subunit n=1 Tax=Paludibacterium sp. TaxID=1917523 RepID=UPI0025E0B99C|nr:multidrug efflux RND transporter permease subunit [Paludibacterium sp.]MBV8046415.1 multidrug efflux RND transporter permease subunit [Paludibacterium sp.]MBV8647977.1 multidrug efflux RND transporter permease subunit [Paludibacterium sp.]
MNLSAPFIRRPVGTALLTLAILLAGWLAFILLPVSPLPQVDYPTISVSAKLPGASPETMASSVATPLERSLGRIAGVTELTSNSALGSTRITLQFDLDRDINGAARDVQAAINGARALLPSGLPSNPTYRKVNPSDAPIMIIALTSKTFTRGQMYDVASTILAQKLAQVDGVGDVNVGGSSLPAVRVELEPQALTHYGISLEQVRTVLASNNANRPKGALEQGDKRWQILANDQAVRASDYLPLIVHYNNGSAVRLADVAKVVDSVQDLRNAGSVNGQDSVVLVLTRQPGANIIETVARVRALLPQLQASIPKGIDLSVPLDRTPTIRASLSDVERTLMISIALVIMVVFLFLRNGRATLIPAITVPVSLVGTFGVMYLAGFSLNNLSLMAMTIATGFVVDDTIVVLENISRHIENGLSPMAAAFKGAQEVGFTVLSMSLSLIAVFIPILLMGGIIGRLFREFAISLSAAILISLAVSLTTTPMLCARWLKVHDDEREHGRVIEWAQRALTWLQEGYRRSLSWSLAHGRAMMLLLLATVCLNVYLYSAVPKGFFPQQDTGRVVGMLLADQQTSFQSMRDKLNIFIAKVRRDPAVDSVVGFTGGSQLNTANMFIALKPLSARQDSADQVIARLRKTLAHEPGATLYLQSVQDIRIGGRASNAQYQYTLQGDDLTALRAWEPKVRRALMRLPMLADVNSDQQDKGREAYLVFDRDTMARLGVTQSAVDSTLNDAFGQRQVSTIYRPLNQYHVVMEVAPRWWQDPGALQWIYVPSTKGPLVPLSAFSHYEQGNTALAVNHQAQFAAVTISFNLPVGVSLSDATAAIDGAVRQIGLPASIIGSFQGSAAAFQSSLSSQPVLILTAILAVYIVLGMLYESLVHPLTILSTLPSAGVGALLALLGCNTEFSVIAMIGVLLLIGIVKKNAIMMIDFAIEAERRQGLSPRDAIFQACMLRFRPIMMTTMAALFGAIPLALGHGDGAELRQPLGISIVGGLLVSQVLTLYTTPVIYLYLDRFRLWSQARRKKPLPAAEAP